MLIFRHWVMMGYSEKLSDILVLEKCEVYSTKSQYSFCISRNLSQKRAITQSKLCEWPLNLNLTCIIWSFTLVGDNLGVIFVWVCEPVFINLSQSYAWSSIKWPIHILDWTKCLHIHILFFDFIYPLCCLQINITVLVSELNISTIKHGG